MIPPRISNAKALDNYNIELTYANGEKKIYNMTKLLEHPAYTKLKNKGYFSLVQSAETTIEWPDGEDVDPNELYNNSVSIN